MASKSTLLGSLGSLLDTLRTRFDPYQPLEIRERWLGLTGRAAALASNVDAWRRLPEESDRYDAVIAALDRATRSLVTADYADPASVGAALDDVDTALDRLEALLSSF